MGASVWQREGAAGGGKTFTSGVVASAPRNVPRPGKRKLIWKRDEHQVPPCTPKAYHASLIPADCVRAGSQLQVLVHAGRWRCCSAGARCLKGRREQQQEAAERASIRLICPATCTLQQWGSRLEAEAIPGACSFSSARKRLQRPSQANRSSPTSARRCNLWERPLRAEWPGSSSRHSSTAAEQCSKPCGGAATAEGEDSGTASPVAERAGKAAGLPHPLSIPKFFRA